MSNLIRGNKVIGILLILIGVGCIAAGGYIIKVQRNEENIVELNKNNSSVIAVANQKVETVSDLSEIPEAPETRTASEEYQEESPDNNSSTPLLSTSENASASNTSQEDGEEEDNHAKGLEFEKYIVGRFGKKYWSIKEWRSDKSVDGRYVESSMNPDLEMKLKVKDNEYVVAIECKWRNSAMKDGKIKWSYTDQVKRYRNYAKTSKVPVFVAIGIGGKPSKPSRLYLVPLSALSSPIVAESDLTKYEVTSNRQFFYDINIGDFKRN